MATLEELETGIRQLSGITDRNPTQNQTLVDLEFQKAQLGQPPPTVTAPDIRFSGTGEGFVVADPDTGKLFGTDTAAGQALIGDQDISGIIAQLQESDDTFMEDIPSPDTSSQSALDIISGLSGTSVGDMSTEDLNSLITALGSISEGTLTADTQAALDTILGAAGGQVTDLEALLASTTTSEADRVAAEQDRARELTATEFAPRFTRLAEQAQQQQELLARHAAGSGSARGSRALEAQQEAQAQAAEMENALAAEQALQERLILAQIQGESDDVIAGIQGQLDTARANVSSLEIQAAETMANLQAELAATGAEGTQTLLAQLEAQAALNQFDPTLSGSVGAIVDSNGDAILDPSTGEPFQFAGIDDIALDEALSEQQGFLVQTGGEFILDDNGEKIPYKPGLQGFTSIGDSVVLFYKDGSYEMLGGGEFGVGTEGGTGGGTGGGGTGTTEEPSPSKNIIESGFENIMTQAEEQGIILPENVLNNMTTILDLLPDTFTTGGTTSESDDLF